MNQKEVQNLKEWLDVLNQAIRSLNENQVDINVALEVDLENLAQHANSIRSLQSDLEDLKMEVSALKLIQIISLKQKLKENNKEV